MKQKVLMFAFGMMLCMGTVWAGNVPEDDRPDHKDEKKKLESIEAVQVSDNVESEPVKKGRFTLGGYGEAVYSRNYYSDSYLRYSSASSHKNEKHSRFDLPHVVVILGYDFGKGWSVGTEIEFEHGGTESAIEIEEEEGGEYESEIERGGEVALEQFWIQKVFCPEFNIKLGHIIVPVGATNAHHLPTEFFGVYRPEGENTIFPCTWHETGISLWGQAGDWRYEALLIAGLDSERFGREGWIHDGSASPYEFKIGNSVAGALRVDNFSIPGLRLSLSGYVGNSFNNTISPPTSSYYEKIKGTVMIGAFDFHLDRWNWVARGNFDYGHLSDSDVIATYNKGASSSSPSPKQSIGSAALAAGVEVGYNIFSQIRKLREKEQKLYLFGRYDYYDSMFKTASSIIDYQYCGRNRVAVGLNYYPIKEIVLKGEYSIGLLKSQYNNEPSLSFGVAYSGLFNM